MKKKPKPARQPVKPGTQFSGGAVQGLGPAPAARKPPPRRHAPPKKVAPRPVLIPGGPVQLVPAKTVAKAKPVKRKLALGEAVACCAAEALAASLRLTGWPVPDADVLALYQMTADDPDEGATILATLEAASMAPVFSRPAPGHAVPRPSFRLASPFIQPVHGTSLILGLDLPGGPHAVLDDGAAWWSWGQPYHPAAFPDAVIEEAWQVTW